MHGMGKWVIGVVILGLLGGGGRYLDEFFAVAPGTEGAVHSVTSGATSTLNRTATSIAPSSCKSQPGVLKIPLDPVEYPAVSAHIRSALDQGAPRVLHLELRGATARYQRQLELYPDKTSERIDLYPIAASSEAENEISASYVPRVEDDGVGKILGEALEGYCPQQAFAVVFSD